ncbi:MAG: threonine synthase [Bdellovibrionales bacterium]
MLFRSTRGYLPETNLRRAALEGLAPDGGLYLPKAWPQFLAEDIAALRGKSYQDIAFHILQPFLRDVVLAIDLREIIQKSYAVFDAADVTPLREMGKNSVLELFHGPTLAFKDVALQFVGHMFDYFMRDSGNRKVVIGATSGDTGSAAIEALANRENIDVFILYPAEGPSDIQRKQMTCVDAANVHVLAIEGTFDDCQGIVKALFADERIRKTWNPTTVNSINILRVLAQIVYYFAAALKVEGKPSFVVPTGNFGDVFAGYAAMKCGLPVEKLVVASNSNNILTRFFATGHMTPEPVCKTLSPSMDIQISSNFERLLFDLCDSDAAQVRAMMDDLKTKGDFSVSPRQLELVRKVFAAGSANDEETLETIAEAYKKYGYVLDPHTAVAVSVAKRLKPRLLKPVVFLATAHPAKFPETIKQALGFAPPLPPCIAALIGKPERLTRLPANVQKVKTFIEERKKR